MKYKTKIMTFEAARDRGYITHGTWDGLCALSPHLVADDKFMLVGIPFIV